MGKRKTAASPRVGDIEVKRREREHQESAKERRSAIAVPKRVATDTPEGDGERKGEKEIRKGRGIEGEGSERRPICASIAG